MDLKNEQNVDLELYHHAIPAVPDIHVVLGIANIPAIPLDVIVISDEEDSNDEENKDIPLDVIMISDEKDSSDEENEYIPLDVIVISSDDEPDMPAKTVATQAISATNTNSPIDVHVDIEQRADVKTAQMDRIWVDLVRKEIKILLDIIDSAEHRIENDTNVVEGIWENITETVSPKVFNAHDDRITTSRKSSGPQIKTSSSAGQNESKLVAQDLLQFSRRLTLRYRIDFQAIYGTWLPTNSKILFIAIYAPQQTSCKRKLWDYISNIVGRWNGESIIMGDFNEVRSSEERRGSCVMVGEYSSRIKAWDDVILKLRSRLSKWKSSAQTRRNKYIPIKLTSSLWAYSPKIVYRLELFRFAEASLLRISLCPVCSVCEAISATNTNSPIDVHVDIEQRADVKTAQMDRIWVDLVRKEIKILLDIIDSAEHRIENDTNVVEEKTLSTNQMLDGQIIKDEKTVSGNENILDDDTNEKDEAGIDIQDSESLSDEDMEVEDDLEDFIDDANADKDSNHKEDTDDDFDCQNATLEII
ncbi:RNA-directed DNA polymerase, eukaryota [Tanacetum coccineum]|uniref:RNA-directed DNA polymerase, eukaryota n=1 Tax=Tanacetum coccineum TaxID=301880 RepID=A0ABQ5AUV4_9ASTR